MSTKAKVFAGFTLVQLFLGAAALAASAWAGWVTHQLTSDEEQGGIVQVQLRAILADYIGNVARSGIPQEEASRRTVAFTQALETSMSQLALRGKVVLVSDAIAAGDVPDVSMVVRSNALAIVEGGHGRTAVAGKMQAYLEDGQ